MDRYGKCSPMNSSWKTMLTANLPDEYLVNHFCVERKVVCGKCLFELIDNE